MNIVVQTNNDFTVVRPDTTWERYNREFYVPDFVRSLQWVPVAYAPMIRPGKFIQTGFAHRYIGPIAYGVLFYPIEADGCLQMPESFAQACCLNHSSILPEPLPEGSWLAANDTFRLTINDAEVFASELDPTPFLYSALAKASQRVLLRNGDILALELGSRQPLDAASDNHFVGRYANASNPILDFQVIK